MSGDELLALLGSLANLPEQAETQEQTKKDPDVKTKEEVCGQDAETDTPTPKKRKIAWVEKLRQAKQTVRVTAVASVATTRRKGHVNMQALGDLCVPSLRHDGRVNAVGVISSTGVEKSSTVQLFSAGHDGHVKVYSITNGQKRLDLDVEIPGMVIQSAVYAKALNAIVACGNNRAVYVVDLESQKVRCIELAGSTWRHDIRQLVMHENTLLCLDVAGTVHSVNLKTGLPGKQLRSGTQQTCMTVSPVPAGCANDSMQTAYLVTADNRGEVFCWSLLKGRCIARRRLEGSLGALQIACTPDRVIVSDTAGLVGLYAIDTLKSVKSVDIVGSATSLAVGSHSALNAEPVVVIASEEALDNVRLVNTAEGYVYQNWPGREKVMAGLVSAVALHGGYLVLGNSAGNVSVWRSPEL